jgi:[ribosomal protein S5]-alanine N-acetyltransferase
MEIILDGVVLRTWSIRDAERLAVIANNKNIADNLRDGFPHPYSLSDAQNWLNSIIPINVPPRFFAIIFENKLTGSIGIVTKEDIYRKNVEIGYFLSQEFWGKGIVTKAVRAATAYAFSRFDIVRVYAEPYADNHGSRRVLEKAGFKCEAVFKNYVIKNGIIKDSCIYSVLREDFNHKLPIPQ